jgi:hypothetical protein
MALPGTAGNALCSAGERVDPFFGLFAASSINVE